MGGRLFVRNSGGGSCVEGRCAADITGVSARNNYAHGSLQQIPQGIVLCENDVGASK